MLNRGLLIYENFSDTSHLFDPGVNGRSRISGVNLGKVIDITFVTSPGCITKESIFTTLSFKGISKAAGL